MSVRFQVVIDCREPGKLVPFWCSALGYRPEPPPQGYAGWADYWRAMGVAEEDLRGVTGPESIVDPKEEGPRIWFHAVPEAKTVKNRLHFDLKASRGRDLPLETRRQQVEAEVARLEALGAVRLETLYEEGVDHYAVAMTDPEGNEFDVH